MKPTKAWAVFDSFYGCFSPESVRSEQGSAEVLLDGITETVHPVVILKAADYEAMQARVDELMEFINEAPHDEQCASESGYGDEPCDCWKGD